ncbi:MAG: succinate dehydrogenase, cytochrome b556 subunit [Alphaproteobacteria bacterium]|nr:succinate dehydrogenase, cytochrome b556 subunit [Alphaproteobacteria bacterium]
MASAQRPLSPHLQVYRWQITMAMSIAHRATGIALSGGAVALVFWLLALANGPDAFEVAQAIAGSWLGYLCLFGWTFCLFYHLANGIRHLVWDMGYGFEIKQFYASGWLTVVVALGLTVLAWIAGLYGLR